MKTILNNYCDLGEESDARASAFINPRVGRMKGRGKNKDAMERSMRMMNKRPRRMRRNKAGMRMMDKMKRPMRQRRRNKARMTMRKKMKSLESSESKENSS